MRSIFLKALLLTLPFQAHADTPQLQNLNSAQVGDVMRTFSALTNFRSLEPAGSWADWFGVSVGLVAQATPAKKLKAVIPNSGSIPSLLPDANAVVALDGPLGLGVELGVFPTTTVKELRLRQYSGNLKWTVNEIFFKESLPFDWALRAGMTDTLIGFKYNVSGVTDTVEYNGNHYNFSTSISKKLWIFEPYVGAGYTTQKATLNNEGRVNLLGSEFTVRSSIDKTFNSFLGYAGVQTHFWFMNLTAQADYQYKFLNYAVKLAAKF